MADLVRYIESSNIPVPAKTGLLARFLAASGDSVPASHAPVSLANAVAGLHVFRQYLESGVTGSALAALAVHSPTGLDVKGVPIDGALAVLMGLAATALPHNEAGTTARNIGAVSGGIFLYRQTGKFLATKAKAEGKKVTAQFGSDEGEAEWAHPSLSGDGDSAPDVVADRLAKLAASL